MRNYLLNNYIIIKKSVRILSFIPTFLIMNYALRIVIVKFSILQLPNQLLGKFYHMADTNST